MYSLATITPATTKPAFLTQLVAAHLDDERVRLFLPLRFRSVVLGRVIDVPEGYECDLASVPRAPLAYWFAGGCADHAAVIHDYLIDTGVLRKTCDAVFWEAMGVSGVPWWRRAPMWAAVRVYGAIAGVFS